jgi:hypothetical protein
MWFWCSLAASNSFSLEGAVVAFPVSGEDCELRVDDRELGLELEIEVSISASVPVT